MFWVFNLKLASLSYTAKYSCSLKQIQSLWRERVFWQIQSWPSIPSRSCPRLGACRDTRSACDGRRRLINKVGERRNSCWLRSLSWGEQIITVSVGNSRGTVCLLALYLHILTTHTHTQTRTPPHACTRAEREQTRRQTLLHRRSHKHVRETGSNAGSMHVIALPHCVTFIC